jgi:pimeloyl-ACP methyl ester carboxylesterase
MEWLLVILTVLFGTVIAAVVLSHAIAWYESASADHSLLADRFAPERLWLAFRLIAQESCFLLVTTLLQPLGWFKPRPEPYDPEGGTPIILLHGLFHNRACWLWIKFNLRRQGFSNLYALNLPPWKDLETLTERVALKIDELRLAGAGGRVHLVGHSMGGMIARNYLQLRGGAERVDRCVLLAAPNHGSKLAPFAISSLGEMLVPGSEFLQRLAAAPLPRPQAIWAIFSHHDNIVLPWQNARLEGVNQVELAGMGHVGMLFRPVVIHALAAALTAPQDARRPVPGKTAHADA